MSVLSFIHNTFPPPKIMSFPCVGIDISDTSLKYIQFERARGHSHSLAITCWGDIAVPTGIVERGNVQDVSKLGEVLKEVKERTHAHYVRMSLPEERAYLFETTLDLDTPPKEMRSLLDFRLEENVPLSPRDAYFDYTIVGIDEKSHIYRVVVVVYAQSTINNYYEACLHAELMPLSFEIEAQAIAHATVPWGHEDTCMIVDFGKTRMGVGIVHKGILMYTSTIEIAGVQLSEDMRTILGNISESEITTIKNTRGLIPTKGNEKIAEILQNYAENIKEELAIRIQYWHTRETSEERTIRKVLVCGGSANLFGLPEFLTENLGIPVERAHVWTNAFSLNERIPEITRRYSYGYATAIGLALKSF